jgi:hypothetical protein
MQLHDTFFMHMTKCIPSRTKIAPNSHSKCSMSTLPSVPPISCDAYPSLFGGCDDGYVCDKADPKLAHVHLRALVNRVQTMETVGDLMYFNIIYTYMYIIILLMY